MRIRALIVAAAWIAGASQALAQVDPASLPAHDSHQGLLVAADPYRDAARYKSRFGKKNPHEVGILAIDVYFRNDNDSPIRLDTQSIRLIVTQPGADRQRLEPLDPEDVAGHIVNRSGPEPTVSRPRLPIPGRIPQSSRGKEYGSVLETLQAASLATDVLPPHATVHGFFYFDVAGQYDLVSYSKLYLPDLEFMRDRKALLFFEVDLSRAAPH